MQITIYPSRHTGANGGERNINRPGVGIKFGSSCDQLPKSQEHSRQLIPLQRRERGTGLISTSRAQLINQSSGLIVFGGRREVSAVAQNAWSKVQTAGGQDQVPSSQTSCPRGGGGDSIFLVTLSSPASGLCGGREKISPLCFFFEEEEAGKWHWSKIMDSISHYSMSHYIEFNYFSMECEGESSFGPWDSPLFLRSSGRDLAQMTSDMGSHHFNCHIGRLSCQPIGSI